MWSRLQWMWTTQRLGPDVPLTHVLLHWDRTARWICQRKFASYGQHASFRAHAYAINSHRIFLGDRVVIRPTCMLFAVNAPTGTITIADDVLLGAGVHIYAGNHRFDRPDIPIINQGFQQPCPVLIQEGAWIGAATVILPGVTIGRNAVVGAGSVVTRDVPAATVAAGNPARILRHIGATSDPAST